MIHKILLTVKTVDGHDAKDLTDLVAGRVWTMSGVKEASAARIDGAGTYYILSEAEYDELARSHVTPAGYSVVSDAELARLRTSESVLRHLQAKELV